MKDQMVKMCFEHLRRSKQIRAEIEMAKKALELLLEHEKTEFSLARSLICYLEVIDDGSVPWELYGEFNRQAEEEPPL